MKRQQQQQKSRLMPQRSIAYRVAIDILGDRMDDDIRSMIQRILNVWTQERIIHHRHDPMLMSNCSDGSNIHQAQCWIARALNPDQFGLVWSNQLFHVDFDTG